MELAAIVVCDYQSVAVIVSLADRDPGRPCGRIGHSHIMGDNASHEQSVSNIEVFIFCGQFTPFGHFIDNAGILLYVVAPPGFGEIIGIRPI